MQRKEHSFMSNESTTVTINPTDNGWQYATGEIPISMTNDFLFCTMLEKNNAVLKSLICALLHLPPEELQTAEIRNPISSGHTKEAVSTVYQLTQDERIRFECQQRKEALRRMNTDKILAAEAKEKLDKTTEKLLEKETLLSKVEVQLSETESQLSKTKTQLSEQNEQLQKQAALIHELERKLQKQKDNASGSN